MEIDYSLLGIGGLYQTTLDFMCKACERFGAKKAESVYLAASEYIREGKQPWALALEVFNECGVKITDEDCLFLKKIARAEGYIRYAKKLLEEAINGKC